MKVNPDFFLKEGIRVELGGNKPLLITDPGMVWMVEQGKVAVFFCTDYR